MDFLDTHWANIGLGWWECKAAGRVRDSRLRWRSLLDLLVFEQTLSHHFVPALSLWNLPQKEKARFRLFRERALLDPL